MAGAIYDLPVPEGGVVTSLPVPGAEANPPTPEQQDAAAFGATAGSMRRGFRAGINSVGSMLNNLIGGSAEALGMTEFAQDRFQEAKHYADFADSVNPAVRDVGQVKDLDSLVDFVAGQAGSGLGTSLPVLGLAATLRRPVAGVFLGSGALEAGEQIGNLRDNPRIMQTTTPGERLQNALIKGGVAGAFETLGGATGQAAKLAIKPGKSLKQTVAELQGKAVPTAKPAPRPGFGETLAHGTVGEALTEGAQDITGQIMEHRLDPEAQFDPEQTKNAIAAGASGGGLITGGAHAVSAVPSAVARTADELRTRLGKKDELTDPDALPPEAFDPSTPVEKIMQFMEESEDKFARGWEKVKDHPVVKKIAEKYDDLSDPEQRTAMFQEAKKALNIDEYKPKLQKVIDHVKDEYKKGKEQLLKATAKKSMVNTQDDVALAVLNREKVTLGVRDKQLADFLVQNGYKESAPNVWEPAFKRSEVETAADTETRTDIEENLPKRYKDAIDEKQLRDLTEHIKNVALNPETAASSASVRTLAEVFARDTQAEDEDTPLIVGGRKRVRELLERAVDRYHSKDSVKAENKRIIARAFRDRSAIEAMKEQRARQVLTSFLKHEYRHTPELRKAAEEQLMPMIMEHISGEGGYPAVWDAAANEAFGEKRELAEEALEDIRTEDAYVPEDTHEDVSEEDVEAGQTTASRMAPDPRADARLGVPMSTESAGELLKALRNEYPERNVKFRLEPVMGEQRTVTIEAEASDAEGLSEAEFNAVREDKKYNRSGFENGILVVKTIDHPAGVKINLVNLVSLMMKREGQQTPENMPDYVADMFSRAMAALMDAKIADKKTGQLVPRVKDILRVDKLEDGTWDLPENTLIARTDVQTPDERRWTYKDVIENGYGKSKLIAKLRNEVQRTKDRYGLPKWGKREKDGWRKPLNQTAEAIRALSAFYEQINEQAARVHRMEVDAMDDVHDLGSEAFESATLPMELSIEALQAAEQEALDAEYEAQKKERDRKKMSYTGLERKKATGGREADALRRAIGRVEREAEKMDRQQVDESGESIPQEPLELSEAEAQAKPRRGAYEEDTGMPLHREPAEGPRGPTPSLDTRHEREAQAPGEVTSISGLREQYALLLAERNRLMDVLASTNDVEEMRDITEKLDELNGEMKFLVDQAFYLRQPLTGRQGGIGAGFSNPTKAMDRAEPVGNSFEKEPGKRGGGQDALKAAGLAKESETPPFREVPKSAPKAAVDIEAGLKKKLADINKARPPAEKGPKKADRQAVDNTLREFNTGREVAELLANEMKKAGIRLSEVEASNDSWNVDSAVDPDKVNDLLEDARRQLAERAAKRARGEKIEYSGEEKQFLINMYRAIGPILSVVTGGKKFSQMDNEDSTVKIMERAQNILGEKEFERQAQAYVDQHKEAVKDDPAGEANLIEEFARKVVMDAALGKQSTENVGTDGKVTAEMKKKIRDYVEKVLGKDKTEVLFKALAHAGEFANIDGVETLAISLKAIDPMSVAYHEALHGFFARLMEANPKAAQVLQRAAMSAPVQARLRTLLKGQDKALAQLKDPEESLAYMYQFWASGHEGLLTIGPNTKGWFEKVKSFLRVITGLWADEMNSAMDMERTGAILDAFHKGEFADRNAVAKVLQEKFPGDARETMDKAWPKLGRLMDKFLFTASGAVRDMNIGPLNDLMDKFHTTIESSNRGPGWLQAKYAEANRRINKVAEILKGKTKEQQEEILDDLRSGQERRLPESKKIEPILKEALDYMRGKGVKALQGYTEDGKPIWREVREIKRSRAGDFYFPRIFDNEAVRKNKDAFIALLTKYGISNPEKTWAKLSEGITEADPRDDAVLGVTLFTPNVNERTLAEIPDRELKPYLNQDLFGTLAQYLSRAARRAEYADRFGNAGEAIDEAIKQAKELGLTETQERTVREAVQAMEGTLGANMSMPLRHVFGALTTYQNIRLLPLALFSSLVDPLGIAVRGGTMKEAFEGFKRGITDLAKVNKDDAYYLAQTVGTINTANDSQVVGDMYSSQFMPSFQRHLNEQFFRYIGMESWNRSMRVAAAAAAQGFIMRHVEKPTEDSPRYLSELGLTPDDVDIKDGKIVLNEKTRRAINMWTDQAILRPNAALRPIYMSDPHWILMSHLKQYTYMFQKVILARVYHEMRHGNYSPAFALAGYVPMIIASDMLRIGLTPGTGDDNAKKGWTALDWLWRGIQRAGIFGPGQFALDSAAELGYGRTGVEALAGPTAQQLMDFVRGAGSGQLGTEAIKALPAGRFFL